MIVMRAAYQTERSLRPGMIGRATPLAACPHRLEAGATGADSTGDPRHRPEAGVTDDEHETERVSAWRI